mgnify:FL=1|tara:strand:+ start:715 stop:1023 length:309 start_codon:yes stop_codon:yes gene_type:complete
MQNHTKVYMDFFGYSETCFVPCEMCQDRAVDIHHLTKQSKFGSKKEKDYIENLIALCRDCHNKCENDNMFNMFARIEHLENTCHQIYGLIEYEKRFKKKKWN